MILASIGYLMFIALIWSAERVRFKRSGRCDFLTLFNVMFCIQLVIPPLITTAVLGVVGHHVQLDNWFYQRIVRDIDAAVVWAVLLMTVCFWAVVYFAWIALGRHFIGREYPEKYTHDQRIVPYRFVIVMALGVYAMIHLLQTMGGVDVYGYINLVGLRAGVEGIGTETSVKLMVCTQAFTMLSTLGVVWAFRCRNWPALACAAALALFFAVMSVSRRQILLEVMVLYFTSVLWTGKFRVRYLLIAAALAFPILLFGRSFLHAVSVSSSSNNTVGEALAHYTSTLDISSSILSTSLDMGRSVTESWASLMYLHLPPRFGIDALLSVLRKLLPSGMLGFDLHWPERIVRISTKAFISAMSEDEPPGLMGQMWLDFRVLGPLVWGVGMALQLGLLQRVYNRCRKTPEIVALYVVLFYIISLVIDTGSFDFTISIDWGVLVALSLFAVRTTRLKRRKYRDATRAAVTNTAGGAAAEDPAP